MSHAQGRSLAAGVLALALAMGIGRFAYTPILPDMRAAFDLPPGTQAALASANYLGYLAGAVLAAVLSRGLTGDRLLRAGLIAIVLATALMATTTSVPVWLGLRLVAGLASAVVFVARLGDDPQCPGSARPAGPGGMAL